MTEEQRHGNPAFHQDCPACLYGANALQYVATGDVPCWNCKGDTIPPTPGHPEERGFYCEGCGRNTTAEGNPGL